MAAAVRDLRFALRALRRAPGLSVTLLSMLLLGTGVSVSLFSLVEAGLSHPAPIASPVGLRLPLHDAGVVGASAQLDGSAAASPTWGGAPSGRHEPPRTIQEVQIQGLRALLWTVGSATLITLMIACSNLALLLLSRAGPRKQEIAMRAVLGASWRRLGRQLFAEGALLTVPGLCAGLVLGLCGMALLRTSWPESLTLWLPPLPGSRATVLTLAALGLSSLGFAFAPASSLRRGNLHSLISGGRRSTGGRGEAIARNRLSVLATASSLVLLAGTVLLLQGFGSAQPDRQAGLDPRDTLALDLEAPGPGIPDPRARAAYFAAMLDEVRRVPGVQSVSVASQGAWLGLGSRDLVHSMTGSPTRPGILRPSQYMVVSPGYFRSLGIPVHRGREFGPGDGSGSSAVAVVSETFAHRFFPGTDPLGKHVQPGRLRLNGDWYTVVGIVGDVRPRGIGSTAQPEPVLYLSSLQVPLSEAGIAVRTSGDPLDLAPAVQRAILRVGPRQVITWIGTLEEYLTRFRAPLRWFAYVFGSLAAFAVALAVLGLYGMIAYNVARRTSELGVRAALGATPGALVAMIVQQAMKLSLLGAGLGLLGAVCLGRLLQYFFHGVDPLDPVVLGGVAALLMGIALLASFAPARAAATVEPSVALAAE